MRRTFVHRRKQITDGGVSLDSILIQYPPLKETEEVNSNRIYVLLVNTY